MTTTIEVMKQAIEALKGMHDAYNDLCSEDTPNWKSYEFRKSRYEAAHEAITALRAAIEAAEKVEKVSKGLQPLVDSCKETRYRRDIKTAVDRFLCWKLPADFAPDAGISFDKQHKYESYRWPIGTNLLTGPQAKAMFEHCLEGTGYVVNPAPPSTEIEELRKNVELANKTFAQLIDWCRAYPVDVFIDPDWDDVKEKLGATLLTQVSAANFRHVLKGVEQIIIGAQGSAMQEKQP